LSLSPLPKLVGPTLLISVLSFLCSSSKILTSTIVVPDPFAILLILL
jgi:hypothetical protein